jgi:hypothetical protein
VSAAEASASATIATVSRSSSAAKSKRELVGALPWAALLQASVVIGRRWHALSYKDRARLTRLLRESGGRLSNLSTKQRLELRRLAGKLDLKGASRELAGLAGGRRGRRKSR